MESNFYETEEFGLAAFIKSRGIDLREITIVEKATLRCKFVFRIDANDERLNTLLSEWANSNISHEIRRVQYAMKALNFGLKQCKINNKNDPERLTYREESIYNT